MDEFYKIIKNRYQVKRLGNSTRYLCCYFIYLHDGSVGLTQLLVVDKTLEEEDMER